jgi:phage gpG-like protein
MRLDIKGVAELRVRLASIHAEEVMARALAEEAERLAQAVREGLSDAPGAGALDRSWAPTGALRDSVGAQADGLQALVGSSDPAAAPQEMGTVHIPPRPFLAPVAAARGQEIARAVGEALAAALQGESERCQTPSNESSTSARTDRALSDQTESLGRK